MSSGRHSCDAVDAAEAGTSGSLRVVLTVAVFASLINCRGVLAQDTLPPLVTSKTDRAVTKALDYLATKQLSDGSMGGAADAGAYPTAMTALSGMAFLASGSTSTRGPYADQIRRISQWLSRQQQENGLIAAGSENGRPMYGHGFALLFLASAYGMETDADRRKQMGKVIKRAIDLTASGQSNLGGWYYTPGTSDEGSVTVTQLQGLRAAHNAGFSVPKGVIEASVRYLELCRTSEGGISYSYSSGGDTRLPITAAAACCLYSAGEYDSPLAEECLRYTKRELKRQGTSGMGHDYYLHFYAAQAFFQAGEDDWKWYFPKIRDQLLKNQSSDGSWGGGSWSSGVGPLYGTSLSCVILQLPYRYLPIYQR